MRHACSCGVAARLRARRRGDGRSRERWHGRMLGPSVMMRPRTHRSLNLGPESHLLSDTLVAAARQEVARGASTGARGAHVSLAPRGRALRAMGVGAPSRQLAAFRAL